MHDDERDPLTDATLEALRRYLTLHIATGLWDEPPELLILTRLDTGPSMIVQAATPLGVPDAVWAMAPVHRVLAIVGQAVATIGPPDDLPGVPVGVTLLTEAWSLELPVDMPEDQKREAREWCDTHSIADHPYGREVKMVNALDSAGYYYLLQWTRGEPTPFTQVTRNDDPASQITGRLPVALRALVDALVADR